MHLAPVPKENFDIRQHREELPNEALVSTNVLPAQVEGERDGSRVAERHGLDHGRPAVAGEEPGCVHKGGRQEGRLKRTSKK